jgi:hypothetical protein
MTHQVLATKRAIGSATVDQLCLLPSNFATLSTHYSLNCSQTALGQESPYGQTLLSQADIMLTGGVSEGQL